jgi:hypothetical protein
LEKSKLHEKEFLRTMYSQDNNIKRMLFQISGLFFEFKRIVAILNGGRKKERQK